MKRILKVVAILMLVFTSVNLDVMRVQASNQVKLWTNEPRNTSGAGFWETTNMREWLNSDEQNPQYTNVVTSDFSREKGFLTNFTHDEQDGIAVTKRRFYLSGQDANHHREDSPLARIPATSGHVYDDLIDVAIFNNNQMKHTEFSSAFSNDKIFIMNEFEIYHYAQMRGIPLVKTNGIGNKDDYWVGANTWNSVGEHTSVIYRNNGINRERNYTSQGVVPALHLKPEYRLNDGKQAKDLKIGDKVNFGRYNGQSMRWEVVNITDGHPLLWSEEIITKKAMQSRGRDFYKYSEHINFPDVDIDTTKDLKIHNENNDVTPPEIKIANRNELSGPKNGSFTLNIEASDNMGIKRIIMPDGSSINSNKANLTVTQNGVYTLKAEDVSGNYSGIILYINNINHPSEVELIPDKDGWSNESVNIQVEANNDIDDFSRPSFKQTNFRHVLFPYNTKISYANKKIRFTGEVKLNKANVPVDSHAMFVGFTYTSRTQLGNGYALQNNYPTGGGANNRLLYLRDLTNQFQKFDKIITVDSEYHDRLNVSISYNYPEIWGPNQFEVEFRNLKTELLDVDDFEITKITLPDGSDVHGKRATYVANKTGKYTFHVLDNRDKITSKSVDVKIDKIKPKLDVAQKDNKWTNQDVSLSINASDEGGSGLDKIVLPDGRVITDNKTTFTVSENGSYEFKVYDVAGNVTTKVHNVSNIDKSGPQLTVDTNPKEWTNKGVQLTVNASDNGSGLKDIFVEGEDRVKNGDFSHIDDNWIEVSGSDDWHKIDPILENTNVDFEKGKVTLKSNRVHNERERTKFGRQHVLTDGLKGDYLVKVEAKGEGNLNVRFGAGGTGLDYAHRPQKVSNNKETYEFYVPYDKSWIDQIIIELLGEGEIEITNVEMIEIKELKGNSMEIHENGKYNIIATDEVQNMTVEQIEIDNIDRTTPTINITQNPGNDKETHEDVILNVKAKDGESGLKSIMYIGEDMVKNGNFKEGLNHWRIQNGEVLLNEDSVTVGKGDREGGGNEVTKFSQENAFIKDLEGAEYYAEVVARGTGTLNVRYGVNSSIGGTLQDNYSQKMSSKTNYETYRFLLDRRDYSNNQLMVERRGPINVDEWVEIKSIKVFAQKEIQNNEQVKASQKGIYTFVTEDNAGNLTTKSHEVTNINKYTKLTSPNIDDFRNVELEEKPQIVSSKITGLTVEDWRDNAEWKLQVSASPLIVDNESNDLIMELSSINKISSIEGDMSPDNNHKVPKFFDDNKIELINKNNQRGKYEIDFDNQGLSIHIPPTAKAEKYESKITWELIMAP